MADSKSGSGPVGQAQGLLAELVRATRNLTYASIGMVGAIGEEAEEVYRRSVKRGERRVRKIEERLPLPERLRRAPDAVKEAGEATAEAQQLPQAASDEWRAVLDRLNLASPQDVETLTTRLAELEAKLDELTKTA
ncbi:MAG: phasin family protein [Anaerolineae bacterium]|jgi:polyhydroxyalkanoate synthesis regulator phasin|nr:phasin family protein [Anaerolineae bacterium]